MNESSDSKVELQPDLAEREVVEAQPLIQMEGQRDLLDGGVHLYSKMEFLEIYQQKCGECKLIGIL